MNETSSVSAPTEPSLPAGTCGVYTQTGDINWDSEVVRSEVVKITRRDLLGGLRLVRRAAKYVVPGTALLYALGFCVCVLHYFQRGVPLHALSHTQFIAAGVLFLTLSASAYLFGMSCATLRGKRGLLRIALATTMLLVLAATQVRLRGGVAISGYWLYAALLGWLIPTSAIWLFRRQSSKLKTLANEGPLAQVRRRAIANVPPAISPVAHPVASWLLTVILFANLMFPAIPQWLGGGDARRVSVFWSAPLTAPERKILGAPDVPCVFEVHTDSDHLYLMFLDPSDSRCGDTATGWGRVLGVLGNIGSKRHYMAVPRGRVASVVDR